MTTADKIAMLSVMVDNEDDQLVLSTYLNIAGQIVINKAYPYRNDVVDVPSRYGVLQCEIAAYLLNKRGAEGQVSHDENGIKRNYGSADVPDDLLSQITPFVGVV